ncbi:undecaprenyl diphosphate synthase family protein [Lachnospiraceae bacterium ZAX-1]
MRIPKHIGIIPDGNRRWANEKGYKKEKGYEFGLLPGLQVLQEAKKCGVEEMTYYGFTVDNCKRPREQLLAFSKACVDAVELLCKEGVSLQVFGNQSSDCFPKALIPFTKRTDINGGGIRLNFLVNYGWKWDIEAGLDTMKSKDIGRIDLIIRWGGMRRLSGFLPIQSVYADFYVIDDFWPDYKNEHFYEALEWYQKQDTTLGG